MNKEWQGLVDLKKNRYDMTNNKDNIFLLQTLNQNKTKLINMLICI